MQVYAWIAKPEVEWLNLPRSSMYQVRDQNSSPGSAPVESTLCLWAGVWWSGLEMVLLVLLGCGSVCLMGFWCKTSGESVLCLSRGVQELWGCSVGWSHPLTRDLGVCGWGGALGRSQGEPGAAVPAQTECLCFHVNSCFHLNSCFHVSSALWEVWGRIRWLCKWVMMLKLMGKFRTVFSQNLIPRVSGLQAQVTSKGSSALWSSEQLAQSALGSVWHWVAELKPCSCGSAGKLLWCPCLGRTCGNGTWTTPERAQRTQTPWSP